MLSSDKTEEMGEIIVVFDVARLDCYYRDSVCNNCKNRWHLAKVCNKTKRDSRPMGSTRGGGSKKRQNVREVGELDTSSKEEEVAGSLSLWWKKMAL